MDQSPGTPPPPPSNGDSSGQTPFGAPPPSNNQLPESDAKTWATFAHLGGVLGLIVPFGSILTPLIIWLINKDKSDFVAEHGKEALNFQITVVIGAIICAILTLIVIGIFLLVILGIASLVFSIMGAIAANKGEHYKYPVNLRLVK